MSEFEQLQFDDLAPRLVEMLRDPRRVPDRTGAARLLRALAALGLSEDALPTAARMACLLDEPRGTAT